MKPRINFLISVLIASIFIGFVLSFFYSRLVIFPPDTLKEDRNTFYLDKPEKSDNRLTTSFDLPSNSYLLKIKHIFQEGQPRQILFNGTQIDAGLIISNKNKGVITTTYIYLPRRLVREGKNTIEILFLKNHPPDVNIILTNYYKNIGDQFALVFSDSVFFNHRPKFSFTNILLSIILVFTVFVAMSLLLNSIFSLGMRKYFLYQVYSSIPFLIFLFLLTIIPQSVNKIYKTAIIHDSFFGLGFCSFFITQAYLVIRKYTTIKARYLNKLTQLWQVVMSNKILILPIVVIVYTVFVLLSLTKEPPVHFDEVAFANNAHYAFDRNEFSEASRPFSGQLPAPGKVTLIMNPPAYLWLLAIATHCFGLNIYTVRLTSFLIGILLLFSFFFILRKIINNDILLLSVLFLLAVDRDFIRASRFGRSDILTVFFITLALLFYIKTLEEDNIKDYFLTGLFSGLSFMTHLALGLLPLVLTNLHFLLTNKLKKAVFRKSLFLIMPALIFFVLWIVSFILPAFLHNPGLFKNTLSVFTQRSAAVKGVFLTHLSGLIGGGRAYYYVRFYIYICLLFPLAILLRNKTGIRLFLILVYLFIYSFMLFIGSHWYTVLLTPLTCLAFVYLIKEKGKYQKLLIAFLVIVISCNIACQERIIRNNRHQPYSYENYSKRLSNYLPMGAKVLVFDLFPDPYFYFASYRKDLKLEFLYNFGMDRDRKKEVIKTADYIIVGGNLAAKKDSPDREFLISYALSHSQSIVSLDERGALVAIFNMKKPNKASVINQGKFS